MSVACVFTAGCGTSPSGNDAGGDATINEAGLDAPSQPSACTFTVTGDEEFSAPCQLMLFFAYTSLPSDVFIFYGDGGEPTLTLGFQQGATLLNGGVLEAGTYDLTDPRLSGDSAAIFVGSDGQMFGGSFANIQLSDGGSVMLKLLSIQPPPVPPPNDFGGVQGTTATHGSAQAHIQFDPSPVGYDGGYLDAGTAFVDISATF